MRDLGRLLSPSSTKDSLPPLGCVGYGGYRSETRDRTPKPENRLRFSYKGLIRPNPLFPGYPVSCNVSEELDDLLGSRGVSVRFRDLESAALPFLCQFRGHGAVPGRGEGAGPRREE